MTIIRIMMGGATGATLAAAIWVAVDRLLPMNAGFLALALGWLVGSGIRRVRNAQDHGLQLGLAASLCTLLAVGATQYVNARFDVARLRQQLAAQPPEHDLLVACYAQRLAEQLRSAGHSVSLAADAPPTSPGRFPASLWNVASEQWEEFLDEERGAYVRQAQRVRAAALGCGPAVVDGPPHQAVAEQFRQAWSIPNLLWLVMAITVSIPLAAAGREDDDALDEDDEEDGDEDDLDDA